MTEYLLFGANQDYWIKKSLNETNKDRMSPVRRGWRAYFGCFLGKVEQHAPGEVAWVVLLQPLTEKEIWPGTTPSLG